MRVTVIATGFDEKKKPETKGIYSSAASSASKSVDTAPVKTNSDIDDIDKIFEIFNK